MNRSISTYSPTSLTVTNSCAILRSTFTSKAQRECFAERYDFSATNATVRDEETGFGYFGARYMDHELMTMWLSVDPMADKYPSISPYAYCAWTRPTGGDEHRWIKYNIVNNPVRLVDPDGREYGVFYDETGSYLGTDGKNDQKIYQTTRTAWNRHVSNGTSPETTGAAGLVPSKYDNLIRDSETQYLGQTNEFGLLQLTRMGNPNIVNNTASEDSYSYTLKDGTTSSMGKHGDDWTAPDVAAAFNYAVNQASVTVVVNDVSAYDGKTNLGHKSHINGRCIDFRYITEDGKGSSNYMNLSQNQVNINNVFLSFLHNAGFYSIGGGRVMSKKIDPKIHNNHIHVNK